MVCIVGVNHHLQFGCCNQFNDQERKEFEDFLKKIIGEYDIELIGEESSEDAKIEWCVGNIAKTIPEKLAENLAIKHKLCDPGKSEREELGIRSRSVVAKHKGISILSGGGYREVDEQIVNQEMIPDDKKRESVWFRSIEPWLVKSENVIFVCGYGHVKNFSSFYLNKATNPLPFKNSVSITLVVVLKPAVLCIPFFST